MRVIKLLGVLVFTTVMTIGHAQAADLSRMEGYSQCVGDYRSGLLDMSRVQIDEAVNGMYERALDVSQRDAAVASTSTVFTWSSEAKVACAKAIGFLKSNDVNGPQISQCDCFYSRMLMAIDRVN